MKTADKPHIIVVGDPVSEILGPFMNWDEACEMAEADPYFAEDIWWPAPLEETRKGEDSISPSSLSNR